MKYKLRFFCESDLNSEIVEIDARNADERQNQIDALWEENDRNQRFDGVEW